MMKKGQVLQGKVERVEFPNKGIVVCEEGTCIVKNSLPGQTVSFGVNKVRKGKTEGRLLEVIEKSPLEIEKACPHFGICGGCSYQSLPYDEQLKIKEEQVRKILTPVLNKQEKGFEDIFEPIKGSPNHKEYRNKMEFSFGDEIKDGPLALGMHKRGSFYDIVTVSECEIVDEDYRNILTCVLEFFQKSNASFYHRLRHVGYLRHLLVRKATRTGEILIALITTTQEQMDLTGLVDALLTLQKDKLKGTIVGILHTKNDSVADVVKSDETITLYGKDYFFEELLGLKFKVSEFSFFQTNTLGAEVLYQTAREYIGDLKNKGSGESDKILFDLYSGTGTIAQMMSPIVRKVIGVEIVEEAVEAAKVNAELNQLHNCEFITGDVLKVIDEIEERPDFIILDPPRDGIHPKALQKIIDFGVERILYISCKPTSLARDLEVFLEHGYEVVRGTTIDQFPSTVHVETVILLVKQKPDDYLRVTVDLDERDVTAAEKNPTYQKIKEYVMDKYGVKVHTRYIAEVKRLCGIEMRENYNKSKKDEASVKHCPQEKVEYIKNALQYNGMI